MLTGGIFFKLGAFFSKLGATNYFGIEKISFFGNYIDPCIYLVELYFPLFSVSNLWILRFQKLQMSKWQYWVWEALDCGGYLQSEIQGTHYTVHTMHLYCGGYLQSEIQGTHYTVHTMHLYCGGYLQSEIQGTHYTLRIYTVEVIYSLRSKVHTTHYASILWRLSIV